MDRHLLGVRTDGIEGINGVRTLIIVEVLIQIQLTQFRIIRISIRAITSAIDVATDSGTDTNSITAIDLTGNIVTTIDIVHITATNDDTRRKSDWEVITLKTVRRRFIFTIHGRTDIGHTATTIQILNNNIRGALNIQEQAFRTGHCTLITAAVEVTDNAVFQVPCRTNVHLGLVVTSKDAGEVKGITGEIALEGSQSCSLCQCHQLCLTLGGRRVIRPNVCLGQYRAVIVNTDGGVCFYRCIVTTAIEMSYTTTLNLQIGLTKLRLKQALIRTVLRIIIVTITTTKQATNHKAFTLSCRCRFRCRTGTDKGLPGIINLIFCCFLQFTRNEICIFILLINFRSYRSCNIISAIYRVNEDIIGSMLTIDIHEGTASDVGHSGTAIDLVQFTCIYGDLGIAISITGIAAAIDVTTNSNLRPDSRRRQKHHQTYYDISNFQFSIFNFQLPIVIVGLLSSLSDNW